MKVLAIVQARMGSTRLPDKVMKSICGVPMIELLLRRLARAKEVNQIIVATSVDERNLPLVAHVQSLGYACEQGSENNVLDRYVQAARAHHADMVVRITGDCPLIDPELVDEVIRGFKAANVEYFSNINPPTYPDGLDIEVFTLAALERASFETTDSYDREHVTPYLRKPGKFNIQSMQHGEDLSTLRWTVDEPSDFEVIEKVFEYFYPKTDFTWGDVFTLQKRHPEIFNINT
jgi:glutamate-1-semialdehyde 2,1-aminomutase